MDRPGEAELKAKWMIALNSAGTSSNKEHFEKLIRTVKMARANPLAIFMDKQEGS